MTEQGKTVYYRVNEKTVAVKGGGVFDRLIDGSGAERLPEETEIEPEKSEIEPPVTIAETLSDEPLGIEIEALRSEARIVMEPPLTPDDLIDAKVPLAGFGGEPP